MIKSMTGFGRAENLQGNRKFTVEMKAVNHRYFDVSIKMPKKLSFFESAIRTLLKTYMQRGKVDVFITYEDFTEENVSLKYNEAIAAQYLKYYRQMADTFGLRDDISVSVLGRCPEVFTMEEQTVDEKEIWAVLEVALKQACEQFVESRITEGERLKEDLFDKLDGMIRDVDAIEDRYPQIMTEYREKLTLKVEELLGDAQMEEGRIAAEVILFADKICTDEETVRLRSHIESMREELLSGGSVGRKLDFLAQEMNREANTILSKANDLETSNRAINLKTEIEKVREQIQNIE
ncbi:YicC-like family%2C N-terminal region [uncultured Clostridium sp.]|uniref:YicC family protein n=1 Tax=Muricoprocola aceti TaxID=2981772 RepID=A0ABT2SHS0_9FIRM|nr:YicC/YloC family endoribonuclease [Muricoprocola aceti]MCU6724046.1 YicC family protein [Muricoprocola aceti]SCG97830.1 YicC-like family%2C N-terminal region [uncultured Clostridium sp.]